MAFISSPQFKLLYKQTLPMLVGLIAIMGCQLVDSAFIGQLGEKPLAVVGFSLPVYQLIIGIQVGIGIAIAACVSIALGEKKRLYAKNLASIALILGGLLLLILCALLWLYQQQIILFLGGNSTLLALTNSYWLPWLISCWLGAILYFGYSICRAYGYTLTPGKVMVVTSVLNMVFDPIFIFTFNLGIAGAAWATCLSFLVGLIIIFNAIKAKGLICIPPEYSSIKNSTKVLAKFATPAMFSQFIPPVSAMLVTMMVASYGNSAIGAWGLANRIETLAITLILAITMALPPMLGQLKGKGDYLEILALAKASMRFILMFQAVLALLLLFVSPWLGILTTNADAVYLLEQYLWLVPISYGALGVCMISVSACNAIGLPATALKMSILRLFICYLPLVWLGSQYYGLMGLFIGACLGNLLSGVVAWHMFLGQFKKAKAQYEHFQVAC